MRRTCVDCKVEKPVEQFYRRKAGYQSRCKPCDNANRARPHGDGIYDRIARELGVSPTRVKQLEQNGLRKLAKLRLARELAR